MTYSTTVFVEAAPDAVFDCLVIPEMMVRWMGDRALFQAVEGGRFEVDINGVLTMRRAGRDMCALAPAIALYSLRRNPYVAPAPLRRV